MPLSMRLAPFDLMGLQLKAPFKPIAWYHIASIYQSVSGGRGRAITLHPMMPRGANMYAYPLKKFRTGSGNHYAPYTRKLFVGFVAFFFNYLHAIFRIPTG